MAAPKKFLVLDLGMQSLRLAEFSSGPGDKLTIHRGARREFILDPSLDASRPEQTSVALKEIIKDWKPSSSEVSCILPAHLVFTRVVALDIPGGAPGQIDALARFEAQQNIPFPLEEVVWDYVVIGGNPGGGVNVAFIAVKSDLLDSISHAISSIGLKITSFTVAPLAIYDAYRHAYPDASSSTTLLLDMGSRTTNLVIAGDNSFFSRSIPSGGLAVTMAIAKDIHSEIDEAELLKISRGSVALGPGFQQPTDPVEANLARISRQTLLKTQADISRSLGYYRSTLGGHDPERIMITGGMSDMPYLSEFLTEKLQKPTVFFDPTGSITVASQASAFVENNSGNLGELIGGALQSTSLNKTGVKLLPKSIIQKRELDKRLPYLGTAALLFLLSLFAWFFYASKATSLTREETSKLTSSIQSEETISKKMDGLDARQALIKKTEDQLRSVIQLRAAYPKVVAELSAKVPERFLWITEIQPMGESVSRTQSKSDDNAIKAIVVKGLYLDNPKQAAVIDDFVTALQNSDVFAVEEQSKSKIITQRGSPNGEYWAYPFSLKIPLRTPIIPLP